MNTKTNFSLVMRNSLMVLLTHILLFSSLTYAQQGTSLTVKGTVVDELGQALPGLNIQLKGSATNTVSNANGEFSLLASGDGTLIFTFIGYQRQEVPIKNRQNIRVVMAEQNHDLEEVVIVGASMKKGDLTGAVVNVSEKELNEKPVSSINEALQGKAAGVFIQNNPQPGGDATIKIRGNNSLQYGGSPIYVVDGVVMEGDFNMLNLSDVQSVNILKDASSTALYGSRGAQGVVVITTKKGSGERGSITYSGWVSSQQFTGMDLTLGAKDMFELRRDALENSNSVGGRYYADNPGASQQQFYDQELFGPGKRWFGDYEIESYKNGKSYNWLDEVTNTAMEQNHALSFSGGSEKGSYYLSFGLNDKDGLMKGSNHQRYSGRINAEQNIRSWLKVGTNTSYIKSADEFVDGKVFEVARSANPLLPVQADSLYLAWGNNWDVNMENPLKSLTIDRNNSRSKIISSNYVNVNPIPGLNIRSSFAIDLVEQKYYEYIPSDIQQAKRDSYLGKAVHNLDSRHNYQWDNSITYDKSYGKHTFNGLFATSLSRNSYSYTNVSARDFPIDDFSYYNLGAAFDKLNFNLGSNFVRSSLLSYLARINYNYANTYFATVTGRMDGSSKFSKDQRWGLFPSVALAWTVSNEEFFSKNEWIDQLKLRFGYGSVGNQRIPDFAFLSLYYPSYSSGNVSFHSNGLRGTPNLTWESQKQMNIGADLSVLNNRLTLNAEYFDIVNSNLLMRRSLSTLTGYREAIVNIGEMTNRGVEISLSGSPVKTADWQWDLSANFSTDKNKITRLYGDVDAVYNFGGYTGTDVQREGNFFLGESLNTIYMLEFDRIIQESDMDEVNGLVLPGKELEPGDILPKDQQKPGEPGYGVIDENDRVIVGKKDPKFYGGFTTGLTWKNLNMNAVFVYSYGAKAVSGYYEGLMGGTGYGAAHKDMLNRWTPSNTQTNVPRATYDNSIRFGTGETSWGIQDASYLRLATLSLSYNLPKHLLSPIGVEGVRINVSGNNLFKVTNYKGYDPENGDWYPTAKSFVFGLNLSL